MVGEEKDLSSLPLGTNASPHLAGNRVFSYIVGVKVVEGQQWTQPLLRPRPLTCVPLTPSEQSLRETLTFCFLITLSL